MKNIYKAIRTLAFVALFVSSFMAQAQYCTPTHSNNCGATTYITNVHIAGTTLYNTLSACGSSSPVTTFAPTGFQTCTLHRDSGYNNYTISVTTKNATKQKVGMWIDFNHDYVFDSAKEWFLIIPASTQNVASKLTFTVPTNAALGQTEMRIRTRNSTAVFDSTSYCRSFTSGTTHRYTITIDSMQACSSSATAGTLALSTDSVCSKSNVFLAKLGGTWAMGQTIQWQWSSDSINWINLLGDTFISTIQTPSVTGYFRYYTSCGSNSDSSAAQFVYVYPLTNCSCTPVHINLCTNTHLITNVSITGTNVNSTVSQCQSASTVWWKFGPGSNTSDSVFLGNTYQFNVTTNFKDIIGMWIDFNHNATFDTYEWYLINKASTANGTSSLYITIPLNADTGYTPIRIRAITSTTVLDSSGACKSFTSGNTHDYQIYLRPLPPCTSPPTAGTAITSDSMICANTPFVLSLQGNTYGTGQNYQWQSSNSGTAGTWSDMSGDTSSGIKQTQTSSTYYRCYITCGGNTDTSTAVYVGLKALYDCYCNQSLHSNVCDSNRMLTNFNITGTSLNNSVNSCSISSTAPHFVFSPSGNLTATLVRGRTYMFNATSNASVSISAWIDLNQSGSFDSAEWTRIVAASGINIKRGMNITIPANTPLGMTGLRIRTRTGTTNTAKLACTIFASGVTHDYIINIIDPPAIDIGPSSLVNPPVALCYDGTEPVAVQVSNYGSDTLDFSQNNLDVTVEFTGMSSKTMDTTLTSGILAPGATLNIYFVDDVDMSTSGTTYDFKIYTNLSGDSDAYNDTFAITRIAPQQYSLNYIEQFNTTGTIPASYTSNGFAYNATNGVGGKGCLRTTFTTTTNSSGFSLSPVIGQLTTQSAIRFSYKSTVQMKAKDTVFVQISTDCGLSYNTIFKIDASNTLTNSHKAVQFSLSAFAGNNVVVRFLKMDSSTNLYYVDIDNLAIGDVPEIKLGNDTAVCDELLLDANPLAFSWDVYWSTGSGPQDTLTVKKSGTYIATATDIIYSLVNSDTINITIYNTPKINLGNAKTACSGTGATLDAGSFGTGYTYLWNTGDTTQTITVFSSGTYSVSVNTPAGCPGNASVKVTIVTGPQGVGLNKSQNFNGQYNQGTSASPDEACVGSNMSYDIAAPSGYSNSQYGTAWTISVSSVKTINGNNPAGSIGNTFPGVGSGNITFTPAKADADSTFIITLTVKDKNTGCDTTLVRYINVRSSPTVSLGSDKTVCPGTAVNLTAGSSFAQYLWSDGSTGTNISPTTAGVYWLKATDNSGCSAIDSVVLYHYSLPKVDIGGDQTVCPGTSVTFISKNAWSKYLWSDGTSGTQITVSTAGTYWLQITDNNGCTNTDSANLNNFTPPTANFGSNTGICPNNSITLDGGTASSYKWSTGANTQTINVNTAGLYWVELTDANGCKGKDSVNINILPKPKATFTYVKNTATAVQFTPDDITHTTYNWAFGDGNNSNAVSPLHNYSIIANYNVSLIVTGTNTCIDSSSQSIVLSQIAQATMLINDVSVFPNPYNNETNLSFNLTKTSFANIELFDLYGRKLSTLNHGNLSAGKHVVTVNTAEQREGVYLLRVSINGESSVLRIVDLK